ncbi:hypothetical protein [Thomasclavelia cocleata]|jgi:hypothetical protein|uniref:hypothetical protein n=1 Tax=Thomasclavelia cocleata TaxID=69824 RepID=UPI002431B506|nr:hypothetical protein [Thomasclavelia cocleata]MCI9630845.1 hypothetical protein [Thomasclavelia cocleata]
MMFTRKRKIIIIWGVVVILIGLSVYLLVNLKRELLEVNDEVIIVEYGQVIPTDPKYYLNVNKLSMNDKNDVLENTKLKSNVKNEIEIIDNGDGTKSERDKGYAAIGTYRIILKYKNETKEVKVIVKDTTKPELIVPKNIEIFLGTDLDTFDFKRFMQATDLAVLNDYIIDISTIDINKIGEYRVKVSIEDVNKNKSEKEFTVIIISPPDSDEEVSQEIVINDDGSKSVKTIAKKKATTINSSNSSQNSNSSGPLDGGNNTSDSSSGSSNNNSSSGSSNGNNNNGSPNSGSNSGSSSGETLPPSFEKTKYYWAKCKECGYYVESTVSIQEAKNKIIMHIEADRYSNCSDYGYGMYEK